MFILANMWFQTLMRQFFFNIDKIVFNFISIIYDFLITIARTSVLSQADILDMADRIYKLLAVFMVFKVTFSLIMYVVNPDDFSDKTKGIGKLTTNIIISLSLLILTPYIFSYAYRLQSIVLENNSLGTLVFGSDAEGDGEDYFNTAGDKMAYMTLVPFFSPNLGMSDLYPCTHLTNVDGTFNEDCKAALQIISEESNDRFEERTLKNYIAGVESRNMPLLFRQDLAVATNGENTEYIIEYRYLFSTVIGVVIVLLLITFCMDVALRSIKLAFLQLIAPIPIISYVDPKSGKDGLFKKWYQMCFKTYISLFIRLLALYFAVYIISRVDSMVDIVNGSYITNSLIKIAIIIGALMFAKQLPKILEGLGVKLDGDGKFFLNPLKKFQEQALGGKRITGAVGGFLAGVPRGNFVGGALRGFASNGGFRGGFVKQADVNRKMSEARMNGAGFFRSRAAGLTYAFGMETADLEPKIRKLNKDKHRIELAERKLDAKTQSKENEKKALQDSIAADEASAKRKKLVSDNGKKLVDFSKNEINAGKAGIVSTKSKYLHNVFDYIQNNQNTKAVADISYYAKGANGKLELRTIGKGELITTNDATAAEEAIGFYEGKQGAMEHLEVRLKGQQGLKAKTTTDTNGVEDFERDADGNIVYEAMTDDEKAKYNAEHADFTAEYANYAETAKANGEAIEIDAKKIKAQSDSLSSEAKTIEAEHADEKAQIAKIDEDISEIRNSEKISFEGNEITIAEAKRIISEREKYYSDIRTARKNNIAAANARRFGPPPK